MPGAAQPSAQTPAQTLPDGTIATDALVIGAGPVGLFQVFQLGLQGISAQVIDALPVPGGQCIELYADKPIYDIPAIPVCTGRELVDRLMQQIRPFSPTFHLGQTLTRLEASPTGGFLAASSTGQHFQARRVFIAAGVGAFQPRALPAAQGSPHEGHQVHYQCPAYSLAGQQVWVVGGDDAAIQAAVDLASRSATQRPARIVLLHRRASLSAAPALMQQWQGLLATGAVQFEVGQILSLERAETPNAPMVALQWMAEDGSLRREPADCVMAFLGLSPKLGQVAHWGLALHRRQLVVDPATCETSQPGIHAVGDVVTYPGKKKLILCGFHEATLAAFAALPHLRPDEPPLLQYTTTSTRLQRRLGVAAAAPGPHADDTPPPRRPDH